MNAELIKEKIAKAVEKINYLKNEIAEKKDEISSLENKINNLTNENNSLKQNVEKLENEIVQISTKNKEVVSDIESKLSELHAMLGDDDIDENNLASEEEEDLEKNSGDLGLEDELDKALE